MKSVLLSLLLPAAVFASVPEKIIFECRSTGENDVTYQIYGDLTDQGLRRVTYVEINAWDPDVKPIELKNQTWNIDSTYRPTKKYVDYNRYLVRENTPQSNAIQVILPNKEKVYALAKQKAQDQNERMVQGDFEGVLRHRDDYGDDAGGQVRLKCGTGWLDF